MIDLSRVYEGVLKSTGWAFPMQAAMKYYHDVDPLNRVFNLNQNIIESICDGDIGEHYLQSVIK